MGEGGQGDKLRCCQDDWGQSPKCPVWHAGTLDSVGIQVETLSLGRWRQTEVRNALLTGVSQWQTDLEFTPGDQVVEDQELKQWQPLDLSSLWNYSDLILSSQCS